MHLILWRHAEAEDSVPDLARHLAPAGRRDAARVGAWLDAHLPSDTRIVVSPAQRALETAGFLQRAFETVEALAPGCSVDDVLACAQWRTASATVLVVGHQPTLGATIARLVGGAEAGYRVQPAAVWWLVRRENDAADVRLVLAPELV